MLQGAFPDGLLPGEASLAQAFGVSRNAIRDAFGILRAEGLLHLLSASPPVRRPLRKAVGTCRQYRGTDHVAWWRFGRNVARCG
ncbi:MAG: GntR family transcriptional regulator [Rhodomicrobium sp.]